MKTSHRSYFILRQEVLFLNVRFSGFSSTWRGAEAGVSPPLFLFLMRIDLCEFAANHFAVIGAVRRDADEAIDAVKPALEADTHEDQHDERDRENPYDCVEHPVHVLSPPCRGLLCVIPIEHLDIARDGEGLHGDKRR